MGLKDLFKPAWRHSNASIRREAIRNLPDQDVETLIEIAISDSEPELRLLAAERLTQEPHLSRVAAGDPGDDVLKLVNQRLNQLWRNVVVDSPNAGESQPLLERIGDEAVLADIASTAETPEVRVAAIQRLRSQRLICQVAETPCGKEAGEAAVEKITDAELLDRLTRNGANKNIRRLAEERLERIRSLEHQPTADDLRRLELDDLAKEAKKLADSWNWRYARERYLQIKQEWKRLDPDFQHPSHHQVEEGRVKLEERFKAFEERQARERELAEARQEVLEQQEALLDQVEDLLPDTSSEAEAKRDSLATAWEELPELPGQDPSPHEPEFRQFLAQHREACEIARVDTAATQRLEALASEAEQLAESDPAKGKTTAKLKELLNEARGIKLQDGNPGPWRSRIQRALEAFQERHEAYQKAAKEANREQQAYLESLCDQLEHLMQMSDWHEALEQQKGIKQVWREAGTDQIPTAAMAELKNRYIAANRDFGKWLKQRREEEHWERWANTNVKEELIRKVEALDNEPDPLKIAEAVKEAQAAWKESGPTPRKEGQELWKRFRAACDQQFVKVKAYYKERDAKREENLKAKQELVQRAIELRDSTAWDETAKIYREMQDQWDEIGPGPRRGEEDAYRRFRDAGDAFFDRLRRHEEEEAAARLEHQEEKVRLCEQAEALADSTDWWDTFADIKRLQEQWKAIGPAPHEQEQQLWQRFQTATQAFFDRLDAARPEHLAAKQQLTKEAEQIVTDAAGEEDSSAAAETLKDLQARWKEIGPAPQEEERQLWQEFRRICNDFFEARRERYQELLEGAEEKMGRKQEIVEQAQALSNSRDWKPTGDRLKALQEQWKEIGSVPFREDRELYQQFRAACNTFFEARDEAIARKNDERYKNLHEKEAICARIEYINGDVNTAASQDKTLDIAEQLKLAMEENFVLGGRSGDSRNAARQEVKKLQEEWREYGAVPRKYEQQLWRRYKAAVDKFYGNKRDRN